MGEPGAPVTFIDFQFESVVERIKHARDGDEGGGAFAFDGAQAVGGLLGSFKDDGGAEERRNEEGHELAEDVAEWNERNEAEWMEPALFAAVPVDTRFERFEIGEKISVGEDYATRFAGGARGKKNLRDVIASDGLAGEGFVAADNLRNVGGPTIADITFGRCGTGYFFDGGIRNRDREI